MSNNDKLLNKTTKKLAPALLLSGLFVALSYIVLLIPFALYSVAQVSAMLGKRVGLLLMALVFVVLFVLSLLLGSPLLYISAIFILVSIPFFMISILLREKLAPKITAALVLFIPLIVIFFSFISLPRLNNDQFNSFLTQMENTFTNKKLEIQKQVETNVSASSQAQLVDIYDIALSEVQTLGNTKDVRSYLSYNTGQRMVWFVFDYGSIFLFFALLISFANIIFLDLAFEQVEKIKAVIQYVLKNVHSFSYDFVLALTQMPMSRTNKDISTFSIVKHEHVSAMEGQNPNVKVIRLSLFKMPNPTNRIFLKGYSFLYEGKLSSWNLKHFSLPLPLAILAIAFMAGVMFWSGGDEALMHLLSTSRFSSFIGLGCVVSFAILAILTLQGFFIFYRRVSNLVGLLFLLGLFILGSSLPIGYYVILAIFGSIALLDTVYDWRGLKKRP